MSHTFDFYQPEIVINCAAYTNVDKADEDSVSAYRINACGPRILALLCEQKDAILVHFSTDYVFSGWDRNTPYKEGDHTNPLSFYGFSKLKGETAVQSTNCKHYILRTSWLYGSKWGLLPMLIQKYIAGERQFKVAADTIGSPTYSDDLALKVDHLIKECAPFGLYHAGAVGCCSWIDFISVAFHRLGFKAELIAASLSDFGLTAKRPCYSVLDNSKMSKFSTSTGMLTWQDGLDLYLLKSHRVSRN